MAKTQALRSATPALVTALTAAAGACVEAIVEDSGKSFDLASEAESLEQTTASALAGSVGAGICHLFMQRQGYIWQDFAANIITTDDRLADFVYDGTGVLGYGLVLAEAKGSFAKGINRGKIEARARDAYRDQVSAHIGVPIGASDRIVYGYATAFGAQRASARRNTPGLAAWLHVSEGLSLPSIRGGTRGRRNSVSTAIALGNYRAAFMLAGAPLIVSMIDQLRNERGRDERLLSGEQRFIVISSGASNFLVGLSIGGETATFNPETPWGTFAVEENVVRRFLEYLSSGVPEERLELPEIPRSDDQPSAVTPIVFRDGLALIPQAKRRRSISMTWSPRRNEWTKHPNE